MKTITVQGKVYKKDQHLKTKLESIFDCKLEAVYSQWGSWNKTKTHLMGVHETQVLIINSKGHKWFMQQSEWLVFDRLETLPS